MSFHLSDEQWEIVAPLVARPPRLETRGRPRRSDRGIVDAALWILKANVRWRRLRYQTKPYPPFQSCHRRFQEWLHGGVLDLVIEALAKDMEKRAQIPLRDCFMDNLFEGLAGKNPLNTLIEFNEPVYFGDPPDEPWPIEIRGFFETPRIWRFLRTCPSPWIQERLPDNLSFRLKFV